MGKKEDVTKMKRWKDRIEERRMNKRKKGWKGTLEAVNRTGELIWRMTKDRLRFTKDIREQSDSVMNNSFVPQTLAPHHEKNLPNTIL